MLGVLGEEEVGSIIFRDGDQGTDGNHGMRQISMCVCVCIGRDRESSFGWD